MSKPKNWVEHPKTGDKIQTYEGWSWPAFLFGGFWLMKKGMWKKFFLIWGGIFVVGLFMPSQEAGFVVGWLGGIVACVVLGIKGNEWLYKKLIEKGYEPMEEKGEG